MAARIVPLPIRVLNGGLVSLLALFALVCGACDPTSQPAMQEDGTGRIQATEDWRIDGNVHDLTRVTWLGVSPTGTLAVIHSPSFNVLFFDSMGVSIGSVGRRGEGPGEFAAPRRGGWLLDTLWISDVDLRRITLIAPDLRVARLIPPQGIVWENDIPRYSMTFPFALYAQDTAVVQALLPIDRPPDATRPSPTELLQVDKDGLIARRVLSIPVVARPQVKDMGAVPLIPTPIWEVSPDGRRFATITFTDEPGTTVVTSFDSHGMKQFGRSFRFDPSPIPQAKLDSVVESRARGSAIRSPATPDMIRHFRNILPTTYPAADRAVFGSDGRLWIGLAPIPVGKPWLVLDAKGDRVGLLTLPLGRLLLAANRTHLWTVEYDSYNVPSVIRYRLH